MLEKKGKNKSKKVGIKYTSYNEGDDIEMKDETTTLLNTNIIPEDHPLIVNLLYFLIH